MSAPGLALECMGGLWGVPEKGEKVAKWVKYGLNGQYHFATLPSTQVPKTLSSSWKKWSEQCLGSWAATLRDAWLAVSYY